MKNRSPEPNDASGDSDGFARFQSLVGKLLTVSKKELDDRLAAERKRKAGQRAKRNGRPPASTEDRPELPHPEALD